MCNQNNGRSLIGRAKLGDEQAQRELLQEAVRQRDIVLSLTWLQRLGLPKLQDQLAEIEAAQKTSFDYSRLLTEDSEAAFTQHMIEFVTKRCKAQSIFDRLLAAANFHSVDSDINNDNFPIKTEPNPQIELEVVHFGRTLMTHQVLARLEDRGLVHAEIEFLLLYAALHPDEQRRYTITGLGSVWRHPDGVLRCPRLCEDFGQRCIMSPCWHDIEWLGGCRFLARRKQ